MGHHHNKHGHHNHHQYDQQAYGYGNGYGYGDGSLAPSYSYPPPINNPYNSYAQPSPYPQYPYPPPIPSSSAFDPYQQQQLLHGAIADRNRHSRNEHIAEVAAVGAGAFALVRNPVYFSLCR